MRVRNKWFTLILWTIIFTITGSLIITINNVKYVNPKEQEANINKPMVEIYIDECFN